MPVKFKGIKERENIMDDLLKRVEQLDNQESIRILEFYAERIFEGMETSAEEMIANIPAEFRDEIPFESILTMSRKESTQPLPEKESVSLARKLLIGFASDPAFAPSLAQALDEYSDDTLMVGEILATGVALSMMIVASTVTFKAKIGDWTIKKEKADPALIKELIKTSPFSS